MTAKKKTVTRVTKKKTRKKAGRPKFQLDPKELKQLESLAACGCTNDEIQAVLQHPFSTLYHNYGEVIKRGRDSRNASLRHKQFQTAMGGNVTMLIFLGKQYLGQTDKIDMNSPAFTRLVNQYETLTEDEINRRILAIFESQGAATPKRPPDGTTKH